ncbi:MAG TPA: uroporphyrinogen-III C-methyltransferase [Mycobacteriales bacterium]|nr:uroporphyrinogen-III C-methyltransferase [Mycobacteriales bacterium]
MRYPLFLDLRGRRVVVVGGGAVGGRRAAALLEAGAEVVVVDPDPSEDLGDADVVRRPFVADDLDGCALAFACTGDSSVNAAVAAAAADRGIWCVRADDADASAAWTAARAEVDGVHVAVSASGDPRRATAVRDGIRRGLQSGDLTSRRARRGDGRVTLVGGGPGDPGLLTLAGYRALLDADVVVADRLGPTDLAMSLPGDVEVVDVGKDPRGHAASQDDINALLVQRALAGDHVVRLKGGDPFVLGRGAEEVAACLDAGVKVDVIPGVSSVTSAATLAGIPLTRRGTAQHFTVASGHVPPDDERSTVDWDLLARDTGTLLLLMAVANLGPIAASLVAGGRAGHTPVAVVENASMPHQRVVRGTLADIADVAARSDVVPPAVVVVGDVVSDLPDAAGGRP